MIKQHGNKAEAAAADLLRGDETLFMRLAWGTAHTKAHDNCQSREYMCLTQFHFPVAQPPLGLVLAILKTAYVVMLSRLLSPYNTH